MKISFSLFTTLVGLSVASFCSAIGLEDPSLSHGRLRHSPPPEDEEAGGDTSVFPTDTISRVSENPCRLPPPISPEAQVCLKIFQQGNSRLSLNFAQLPPSAIMAALSAMPEEAKQNLLPKLKRLVLSYGDKPIETGTTFPGPTKQMDCLVQFLEILFPYCSQLRVLTLRNIPLETLETIIRILNKAFQTPFRLHELKALNVVGHLTYLNVLNLMSFFPKESATPPILSFTEHRLPQTTTNVAKNTWRRLGGKPKNLIL